VCAAMDALVGLQALRRKLGETWLVLEMTKRNVRYLDLGFKEWQRE
jgi:hypothetical protein